MFPRSIPCSSRLACCAAFARSGPVDPRGDRQEGWSIYLLFAIGFKGGVSVADYGIDQTTSSCRLWRV